MLDILREFDDDGVRYTLLKSYLPYMVTKFVICYDGLRYLRSRTTLCVVVSFVISGNVASLPVTTCFHVCDDEVCYL